MNFVSGTTATPYFAFGATSKGWPRPRISHPGEIENRWFQKHERALFEQYGGGHWLAICGEAIIDHDDNGERVLERLSIPDTLVVVTRDPDVYRI